MAEFHVLGPVEVQAGTSVITGPPRQRAVLAALLVDAGRLVTSETLIDRVWGDERPNRAPDALYPNITRIRRLLTDVRALDETPVQLLRRSGGYLLAVDPDLVDVHRFRRLVDQAGQAEVPPDERARLLREGLALWRGEPLAGVASEWAVRTRDAWRQQFLDTMAAWAQAELRVGNPGPVISRLTALTVEYPFVESLAAVLLQAMHAAGRTADALDQYTRIRQRLADELGVDPGLELRQTHQAILRGDPGLITTPAAGRQTGTIGRPVPAQLPADVSVFTGRAEELAELTAVLTDHADRGAPVVISAIGGAGGIGKTWLALHWAHQHRDRFPDGQLFVNLRGFDPSGQPMAPAIAVRGFLDALGVAPRSIPADLDAQIGLYRSLVAGRRMLVVLDNARDTGQVTGLLPGSASCAVIVTSRDRLTGLVSGHGARPLALEILDDDAARELLARRLGERRLAAEPDAVPRLVAACGGLPLALGIAAARAAVQPGLALAVIAKELDDAATRLGALDADHPQADLRTVLSWSTAALSKPQARLFSLLGLAVGPDVSPAAAAALSGRPTTEVAEVLWALERQSLLHQHAPGRWRMHDLVRLYATEQADADLTDDDRRAAARRLVDFAVHTANAADRILNPHRTLIALDEPAPGAGPLSFSDEAAALAWLDAEHAGLLAIQQFAADQGWHRPVWQLAWTLTTFHARRGHLHEQQSTWLAGLAAARRLADPAIQAMAHRRLGNAYVEVGQHAEAEEHLRHALELAREAGNLPDQAHTHWVLSVAWEQRGDDERSLEHAAQALEIYRAIESPVRQADALNLVGWTLARLGRHAPAREHLEAALILARRHQHHDGEAVTLDSLGYLNHQTGQYTEAVRHYQQALTILRRLGASTTEADTLERLGGTYAADGQLEQAHRSYHDALRLYRIQHRTADADRVERRLREAAPGH